MIRKLLLLILISLPTISFSQIFYTETFDGTPCAAGSGCDPSLILWTTTNVTANGATANKFFVSDTESGMAAGQCGAAGAGDQSLHVGNIAGSTGDLLCPTGDCGAAYDASTAAEVTDKRCESPTISCAGQSNITIAFNYIENGEGANDDASLVYFDGATWTTIDPLAKTPTTCAPQGTWTAFSMNLPASANNNANVRIGFRWVNDGNGSGGDPSFAVDDITLSATTTTPPVASFTASDQTPCTNDCISFTNTSTGAPFTTTSWTFTGGTPSTSTANNPTNICYNTPGTYQVALTVTNANGTDTETQVGFITVASCTSPPVASFTASDQTICSTVTNCVDFTNTSTGGPFTTTSWTFTGGTPATSTANNPTGICYSAPGTYAVSLTVTDANGTDTETQAGFITVSSCSSAPVTSFTASTQTVCAGATVTFTDNSTNNPTTWNWTFAGGTPATSTSQNPTITYSTPGTYSVSLTATNGVGSNTSTQNNYITVINCPAPVATFTTSSAAICEGDCITINNTSTNGTSYVWTFNGGTPSSSTSQNPGTICFSTAGTYTIDLAVTNASGTDNATTTIVVSSAPTVTAFGDTTVNLGNSVPISAIGSGSGNYVWTPSTGVTCATCASTTVLPQSTTNYIVTYSEGGCSVTDTVFINVNIIEGIGVPNAFSPNGDGSNDELFVLGQGIFSLTFKIYNRYGQLVFETTDQSIGWDGKHNGKDANTGVFAYMLEYVLSSGEISTMKGNITLVR